MAVKQAVLTRTEPATQWTIEEFPAGTDGQVLGIVNNAPAFVTPSNSGGGAKATYIDLIQHFTTLEETTSAGALWKIPAVATYGRTANWLNMTKLGTPTSAEFVVVYTNTATSGTNKIGFTLGLTPRAEGSTVIQVLSSEVTLANTATYPQTIVKAITVLELGVTAQWIQLCLNLASGTVGPNIYKACLVLYY